MVNEKGHKTGIREQGNGQARKQIFTKRVRNVIPGIYM